MPSLEDLKKTIAAFQVEVAHLNFRVELVESNGCAVRSVIMPDGRPGLKSIFKVSKLGNTQGTEFEVLARTLNDVVRDATSTIEVLREMILSGDFHFHNEPKGTLYFLEVESIINAFNQRLSPGWAARALRSPMGFNVTEEGAPLLGLQGLRTDVELRRAIDGGTLKVTIVLESVEEIVEEMPKTLDAYARLIEEGLMTGALGGGEKVGVIIVEKE